MVFENTLRESTIVKEEIIPEEWVRRHDTWWLCKYIKMLVTFWGNMMYYQVYNKDEKY